jgi:hypothetical protein
MAQYIPNQASAAISSMQMIVRRPVKASFSSRD